MDVFHPGQIDLASLLAGLAARYPHRPVPDPAGEGERAGGARRPNRPPGPRRSRPGDPREGHRDGTASRTLQAKLPDPAGAEAPTVVLRMRGRTAVGATFVKVVDDYATALDAVGGRLYLSGVDHAVAKLLRRTDRPGASEPVGVFEATEVVGESTTQALLEAEAWAVRRQPPNSGQ